MSLGFVDVLLISRADGRTRRTRAPASGRFRICGIDPGTYEVTGTLVGYSADPLSVEIQAGMLTQVAIRLAASATGDQPGALLGRVTDGGTGVALDGALVVLPDAAQRRISGDDGAFAFLSVPPGILGLRVSRVGYGEAVGQIRVGAGETVTVEVKMGPKPIELEPIVVTASRKEIALPAFRDFERRLESGFGQFVLEEEIVGRVPHRVTDLLQGTGVTVLDNGRRIFMRRSSCAPTVYIDGVRVTYQSRSTGLDTRGSGADDPMLEAAEAVNMVHPSSVKAIEVYRGPGETPSEFLDSNSRCGVILVWTRRGA